MGQKLLKYFIGIAIIIIILNIFIIPNVFQKSEILEKTANKQKKEVEILTLNKELQNTNSIKISGIVKPSSKIDIISMGEGISTNINFKVGDYVYVNQIIANLYDNSIKSSKELLEKAIADLKTAEDNYNNNVSVRIKTDNNTQENAIIIFNNSLNIISNALNEIDYIIDVEKENQLPGIAKTLSILNKQSLIKAKNDYSITKNSFNSLLNIDVNENNILSNIELVIDSLNLTKKTIDDTISVLNNTIPSSDLSEDTLNSKKSAFFTLQGAVITATQTALQNLQALQNLNANRKKDIDVLKNALESAKKQVNLSRIAYDNLLSDLTIRSSTSGQVTQKYIELGEKINIGQKIAEISKTNIVKIETYLSSDDIYKISLGQEITINNNLSGYISHIDPIANSVSRKVKIEISFNNKDKILIPETFVDIIIQINQKQFLNDNIFLIPIKALSITQNENFVFIEEQGIAKKIIVETGKIQESLIEIINGLTIGDKLIIEGNKNLEDGDYIEMKNY